MRFSIKWKSFQVAHVKYKIVLFNLFPNITKMCNRWWKRPLVAFFQTQRFNKNLLKCFLKDVKVVLELGLKQWNSSSGSGDIKMKLLKNASCPTFTINGTKNVKEINDAALIELSNNVFKIIAWENEDSFSEEPLLFWSKLRLLTVELCTSIQFPTMFSFFAVEIEPLFTLIGHYVQL